MLRKVARYMWLVWFMVFNATFNNISVISLWSLCFYWQRKPEDPEKTVDLSQVTDILDACGKQNV